MNNANNIFEVGKIIRKRRIELGMTQEELAFKVGYKSRVSINKIELGRTLKLSLVKQFADALQCSTDYIMGFEKLSNKDKSVKTETNEIYEKCPTLIEMGRRIKNKRKAIGMTQTELAEHMGYSGKSSVCNLENGDIDLPQSKIVKLAEILKVSPSYIMGWEELPDEDAEIRTEAAEAIKLFKSLTPENRKFAIEFMKKLG